MAPPPRPLLALLVAFALAGCKKDSADDEGAPAPAPPRPVGQPSDVTGTNIDIYLTAQGEVRKPLGSQDYRLSLLSPKPDGTFTTLVGTVGNDGTFRIPQVPPGTYYLRYQTQDEEAPWFTVTDKARHDFGVLFAGRPDAVSPMVSSPITFDLEGLQPWQRRKVPDNVEDLSTPGDDLVMFSLNAQSYLYLNVDESPLPMPPDNLLKDGDTRLAAFNVDLADTGDNLVDGSRGDVALIYQSSHQREGGTVTSKIVRAFSPAPFTHQEGQPLAIAGTLQELPQQSLSVTWNQGAFAALARDVNPMARTGPHTMRLTAEPAGPGKSSYASVPSLLRMEMSVANPGVVSLPATFGNPLPAQWPVIAFFWTEYRIDESGASAGIVSVGAPLERLQGAVAPVVSPPRDVRMNGVAVALGAGGVGQTPTIEWKPPSLGTVSGYSVTIEQEARQQAFPSELITVAFFDTTGTSLRVPPGLIGNGRYRVTVWAYHGKDATTVWGRASAISGWLTP